MLHEPKMAEIAKLLKERGYEVDKPNVAEDEEVVGSLDANTVAKRGFIDEHFAKIDTTEAILVVNEDKNGIKNYIGGNTLIEVAYAYGQGLDIFLLNPVPELSYADEVNAMNPIILDGDINNIDTYVATLPLVMMSTTSQLKHKAVGRALRRIGVPVRVDGIKVPSGVAEQPSTMDETYLGAMNRHQALKDEVAEADYFITIESGLHQIHDQHSSYGCSALIIEKSGETMKVGMNIDIEFPKEMLDKVPATYPDIGVLVQQEFGSKDKDPFPFITNGKLTRLKILENSLYNVAIQLEK